jgi:RNA polymerase sigma factor (sigma-70 family)
LGAAVAGEPHSFEQIIDVDRKLTELALLDERQARIVEARIFGGLTEEEIAELEEISVATVRREWTSAKAWLQRELSRSHGHDTPKMATREGDL